MRSLQMRWRTLLCCAAVALPLDVQAQNAAGSAITTYHALNTGRKCYIMMRISLMDTIRDCSVVIERGKYLFDGSKNVVYAVNIQKSFLLPCKRRIRQIFCGCRGSYSPRHFAAFASQYLLESLTNFTFQTRRQWRVHDQLTNLFASIGQRCDVFSVECIKHGLDSLIQSVLCKKIAVKF